MAITQRNFENYPVQSISANNKAQKKPVYYCRFGSVVGPLGTGSADIPNQYSTGAIQNALVSRRSLLIPPSTVTSQITVNEGKSSISSLDFTLLDLNGEITNLIASHTMKNRIV